VAAVDSPRLLKLAWPARCTLPVPVPTGVESARAFFHSLRAGIVLPPNHLKSLKRWKFLTNIAKPTRRPARQMGPSAESWNTPPPQKWPAIACSAPRVELFDFRGEKVLSRAPARLSSHQTHGAAVVAPDVGPHRAHDGLARRVRQRARELVDGGGGELLLEARTALLPAAPAPTAR
jgi:hypothetical protein